MKLSTRYNRVNTLISIAALIITGIIYYLVIHLILTNKLDRDLTVEENEIRQYTGTYHKLPLPASFLDQQVSYQKVNSTEPVHEFSYTNYYNAKEKENEPGRSLVTAISLNGEAFLVTITKSRLESEGLVRIILLITLGVTILLLLAMLLINRFVLNRLWQPFYVTLKGMKDFELSKMEPVKAEPTGVDEFNELNASVNAMAESVRKDYRELKSFTDNASHEMMTPLAVIQSKLDTLLQTGAFTDQQGALLEDIYNASGKLSRLHQSLLLLVKIENNLIPDNKEIDLKEIIESKVRQFHELFDRMNLKVTTELDKITVNMSGYLADILLNNLIGNAIRHNIPGGNIHIQLISGQLTISNSGQSEELPPKLFERFSKSGISEGLGLGLTIIRQICSLYGFHLEYQWQKKKHFFTIDLNSVR